MDLKRSKAKLIDNHDTINNDDDLTAFEQYEEAFDRKQVTWTRNEAKKVNT